MREGTKMVDETNNANQSGSDENKQKELQQAIERVNRGLEDLTPDELSRIYRILKAHNGEIGDAGTAFARLDEFAQKKVKDFADGKENLALEDMNGIVALEAELAAVHQPDADRRQTPAADRVNRERRDFDAKNGLTHLTPSSKEFIDKNLAEMDALLKNFNPEEKGKDGKLLHPEMASFNGFFEHLDLQVKHLDQQKEQNDENGRGFKNKDELRKEMLEMAILQALSELSVNPGFDRLSADEKKKRLFQAIGSHADAMALELLQTQLTADFLAQDENLFLAENGEFSSNKDNLTPEEKEELDKKIKEFKDKVDKTHNSYVNGQYPDKYNLNSNVAAVVLTTNSRNQVAVNNRIAEKTGHLSLKERALKFDARMKKQHPKIYAAIKKGIVSGGIGLATGGVGLAALSAYRTCQLFRTSYKTYKDSGFDGSYINYLGKNPKELVSLSSSIVLTCFSMTFGGIDVVQHGWNAVGVVGRAIGDTAAAEAGNKLFKAAMRGGVSVTSGLANAGLDFRAARREPDKAKRKQLYKQAAITAGISIVGSAIGIFGAEYGDKAFGWLRERFSSHDDGVDGIAGAAPKVSGVQPQPVQQTPDLARTNENQLDAKQDTLGYIPPENEAIRKHIEELGPLAKETPATENQETGVQKTETGVQKTETGNQKTETGVQKTETGNQKTETGNQKTETGNQKTETGNQKTETNRKSENRNRKSENRNRSSENRNRKSRSRYRHGLGSAVEKHADSQCRTPSRCRHEQGL